MSSPRTAIRDALAKHLAAEFGPGGSDRFRRVTGGRWDPAATDRPNMTVVDDGQRRADGELEGFEYRRLRLQIILDLEGDVSQPEQLDALTDLVEDISAECCSWRMEGLVEDVEFVDDDPYTAEIDGGAAREVWIIQVEVIYYMELSGQHPAH